MFEDEKATDFFNMSQGTYKSQYWNYSKDYHVDRYSLILGNGTNELVEQGDASIRGPEKPSEILVSKCL